VQPAVDHVVLAFVNGANLTAAVIPAVRTRPVRWFRFAAIRAVARLCGDQRVVRAALGRARLRVPPFRIWHGLDPLL